MNGRVYDLVIGRFLSADPFIQAPFNSQSYNRYSYVWNNPLSAVDPSGYEVVIPITDGVTWQESYTLPVYSDRPIHFNGQPISFIDNHANFQQHFDNVNASRINVEFTAPQPTFSGGSSSSVSSGGGASFVSSGGGSVNTVAVQEGGFRDYLAFVPVVGSALDAFDSFSKGNIGMGLLNVGLALTDLTGAGAIVKGLTVGTLKWSARKQVREIYKSSNNWNQMRRKLQRANLIPRNSMATPRRDWLTTDHIFIKQRRGASHWLTNHPANLQTHVKQSRNSAYEYMNPLDRAAYLPTWMKLGGAGVGSYGVGLGVGSGE